MKLRKFANLNMPVNFLLKISYEWAKKPQFDLASNHFYFFFRCFTGTIPNLPEWHSALVIQSLEGWKCFICNFRLPLKRCLTLSPEKWAYSSPVKLRKFGNLNMPANFLLKISYEWAKKPQFDLASNHFYFFSDVLLAHAPNLPEWHSALVIQSFGRLEMFYLQLPVASETLLDSKSWKWAYSSPVKLRKFANLNMASQFFAKNKLRMN